MDTEYKWISAIIMVIVVSFVGFIGFDTYLKHQRDLACIQQHGSPVEKTCIYGVAHD